MTKGGLRPGQIVRVANKPMNIQGQLTLRSSELLLGLSPLEQQQKWYLSSWEGLDSLLTSAREHIEANPKRVELGLRWVRKALLARVRKQQRWRFAETNMWHGSGNNLQYASCSSRSGLRIPLHDPQELCCRRRALCVCSQVVRIQSHRKGGHSNLFLVTSDPEGPLTTKTLR